MTQIKLILYLVCCGLEIYFLKYFTADSNTIFWMKELESQPFGKILTPVLQGTNDNMTLWANPLDMEKKENKLTY